MKFFTWNLLCVALVMSSCGQLSSSKVDKNPAQMDPQKSGQDSLYTMFIDSDNTLPVCDATSKDRLVYVSSSKKFKRCSGSSWEIVEIVGPKGDKGDSGDKGDTGSNGLAGPAGLTISSTWRFHTDTLGGQPDISTETTFGAESRMTFIGTIQLVVFADGSGFVSVAGSEVKQDTGGDNITFDFSHSFFLKASTSEQEYTAQIDTSQHTSIRYKVMLSATSTPTFKAVVDVDGNFANNVDTTYALTKVNQ